MTIEELNNEWENSIFLEQNFIICGTYKVYGNIVDIEGDIYFKNEPIDYSKLLFRNVTGIFLYKDILYKKIKLNIAKHKRNK